MIVLSNMLLRLHLAFRLGDRWVLIRPIIVSFPGIWCVSVVLVLTIFHGRVIAIIGRSVIIGRVKVLKTSAGSPRSSPSLLRSEKRDAIFSCLLDKG